jgi:hypothetical protein
MNERIQELIKQCEDYGSWDNKVYTFDKEKFAELIVRECMTTVLKESKWYWDKDEFESANAIQNAARRVKEHFGVES